MSGPNEPQPPSPTPGPTPGPVPRDEPIPEIPPDAVPAASEPVPDAFSPETPRDPHWFKTAVFYEVSVRGFAVSSGLQR